MKKKLSYPVLLLLVTAANAAFGIAATALLPERIAVHFDASFKADRLGSPWLLLPCFLLPPVVAAGLIFESRRRGQNIHNRKPLNVMFTAIAALLAYIGWLMLGWCGRAVETGQTARAPMYLLVNMPIGILIALFGNYLPIVRRNSTLGIKTPSTLASEYVWTQTHRMMGKIWVGIGLGEIFFSLVDHFAATEFLSFAWLLAAVPGECIALPFVTSHFKKQEQTSPKI